MTEDGKACLLGSGAQYNSETEKGELIIKDPGCAQEAVDVCPVQCIRIEKKHKNTRTKSS